MTKWTVGTLDLDWVAASPETVPHNGREILCDLLEEGAEVLGVWWEPLPGGGRAGGGFARVLYRVPAEEA